MRLIAIKKKELLDSPNIDVSNGMQGAARQTGSAASFKTRGPPSPSSTPHPWFGDQPSLKYLKVKKY